MCGLTGRTDPSPKGAAQCMVAQWEEVFTLEAMEVVHDLIIWARLTKTVQFKFEIVKKIKSLLSATVGVYDTNLSSTTYHLNISKTKRRWDNCTYMFRPLQYMSYV